MSVSRIYRVLRLIAMLQSGRSYTVSQLARELQVSRRTVFRDLNMLEMAQIPYYFDRERRTYRINRNFFLSPIDLTLPEALALLVGARQRRGSAMQPLAAASARAALKLESVLPQPVREYLGTVLDGVAIVPAASARQKGLDETFDRLVSAVAQHKVCRAVYISFLDQKQVALTLEPLRVIFVGRAWYVIAYSWAHRESRTFKLGRFRKLTVTEESFDPSAHPLPQREFGDAWSMIPEGKLCDVRLNFSPKVAGNVAEVNWHHSQRVQFNDDGSLDFRAWVDGLGEIAWWVLGYGDQVKVLEPKALARRVARTAWNVAAKYRG